MRIDRDVAAQVMEQFRPRLWDEGGTCRAEVPDPEALDERRRVELVRLSGARFEESPERRRQDDAIDPDDSSRRERTRRRW